MVFEITGPFGQDPLQEVPLSQAPLVNVICQIRFPNATALGAPEGFQRVALALASEYPSFEEQQEFSIQITPAGVTRTPTPLKTWTFISGDSRWRLNVSLGFMTLFTAEYGDRNEFLDRLVRAWSLLRTQIVIPRIERIGFRYVNHIGEPDLLLRLPELVRPEFLGANAVPLPQGTELSTSLSQAQFRLPDSNVLVSRWGTLPAGASVDPTMAPVERPTWVLDIDAAREAVQDAKDEVVAETVSHVADRAYRYFRWIVTPEFLDAFGGES